MPSEPTALDSAMLSRWPPSQPSLSPTAIGVIPAVEDRLAGRPQVVERLRLLDAELGEQVLVVEQPDGLGLARQAVDLVRRR
jgi:hypothetical protein